MAAGLDEAPEAIEFYDWIRLENGKSYHTAMAKGEGFVTKLPKKIELEHVAFYPLPSDEVCLAIRFGWDGFTREAYYSYTLWDFPNEVGSTAN